MFARDTRPEAVASSEESLFTIGEMARTFNVTLRALRFYEDRGLIQPMRNGATRLYDSSARSRLRLILRGKQLGFTLTEIRQMLAAHTDEEMPSFELSLGPDQVLAQIDMLQRQREDIERAISDLKATHEKLAMVGRRSPASESVALAANMN